MHCDASLRRSRRMCECETAAKVINHKLWLCVFFLHPTPTAARGKRCKTCPTCPSSLCSSCICCRRCSATSPFTVRRRKEKKKEGKKMQTDHKAQVMCVCVMQLFTPSCFKDNHHKKKNLKIMKKNPCIIIIIIMIVFYCITT